MSSDEVLLEEMLERATSTQTESDELSMQIFCIVVKSNRELVHKAQEMLIKKMQDKETTVALKAISLLGECMTKGGTDFQDEAAKFRFLNELIRMVSIKYNGAHTESVIKQRIMEYLLLWTTEFPKKTKIQEAYEMLQKEGDSEANKLMPKNKSVLGIDEEMLARLIKSGDPENLRRANLLIQHRVHQDARKTELIVQHKKELREINNTISLLDEMLTTCKEVDEDTAETMKELYKNCKKHKSILKRMPELLDVSSDNLLAETLETNDFLQNVMSRFKNVMHNASDNRNDVAAAGVSNYSDELLTGIFGENSTKIQNSATSMPANNESLAELSDIFHSIIGNDNCSNQQESKTSESALLQSSVCLKPSKVYSEAVKYSSVSVETQNNTNETKTSIGLEEIDKISEELLKQNLERPNSFIRTKIESKKPTLNDLVRQGSKSTEKLSTGLIDAECYSEEKTKNASAISSTMSSTSTYLSKINIDLDDITPGSEEILLFNDNDLDIKMVYASNRPTENVTVIVLTSLNKSNVEITDYQIEASVKKPSKVRLLQPTNTYMAPRKPFRHTVPINQILLLLNPTGHNTDVTLLVGYRLGQDPDAVKESIVIKDIPYNMKFI